MQRKVIGEIIELLYNKKHALEKKNVKNKVNNPTQHG